jgi:hypothetical protein
MAIIMNNYDRVRDELHDNPDDISMHMRRMLTKKVAGWFPALFKAFGLKEAQSDSKTLTLEDCARIWANDSEALQSVGITCPEDMLQVVSDGDLDGGLSLDEIVRRASVALTLPSILQSINPSFIIFFSKSTPPTALPIRSCLVKRRAMTMLANKMPKKACRSFFTRSADVLFCSNSATQFMFRTQVLERTNLIVKEQFKVRSLLSGEF